MEAEVGVMWSRRADEHGQPWESQGTDSPLESPGGSFLAPVRFL